MAESIKSFTQLRTWQKARSFAVSIYKITQGLPSTERFGIASQLQRASVSIAANIAEGFSRNSQKEKINFYGIALGSLTEVESHLYISSDLGFVNKTQLSELINEIIELQKMINGLKKSAKGRNT
jgi:four helix bundle protein